MRSALLSAAAATAAKAMIGHSIVFSHDSSWGLVPHR